MTCFIPKDSATLFSMGTKEMAPSLLQRRGKNFSPALAPIEHVRDISLPQRVPPAKQEHRIRSIWQFQIGEFRLFRGQLKHPGPDSNSSAKSPFLAAIHHKIRAAHRPISAAGHKCTGFIAAPCYHIAHSPGPATGNEAFVRPKHVCEH
jgi:hypothetical protein